MNLKLLSFKLKVQNDICSILLDSSETSNFFSPILTTLACFLVRGVCI